MTLLRWPLSILFVGQMYVMLPVIGLICLPFALWSGRGALMGVHAYCTWVRWSARWMVGLKSEVRGTPPQTEAIIAAKHQSFFDIIIIASSVPSPKFIMKQELLRAPVLGWYAKRIGCVPVDRGRRGAAIAAMKAEVQDGTALPGQLVIYPQGTRVPPGAVRPYKVGTGLLYEQLGQTCHPAATNVGHFWPRRSLLRLPGTAVVQFLDPIPPGLPVPEFMALLQAEVETASEALSREAGF